MQSGDPLHLCHLIVDAGLLIGFLSLYVLDIWWWFR